MSDQRRGNRPEGDRYEKLGEEARRDQVDDWTASMLARLDKMDKKIKQIYARSEFDSHTQQQLRSLQADVETLRKLFA